MDMEFKMLQKTKGLLLTSYNGYRLNIRNLLKRKKSRLKKIAIIVFFVQLTERKHFYVYETQDAATN